MQAKLNAIKSSCLLHMKVSFSRATFRFCVIAQPILYAFILYMMYKGKSTESFINYVILGSGIISFWSSICFSSAGDIERERFMGTLKLIIASPANKFSVFVGRSTLHIIDASITVIIGLLTGFILFGFALPFNQVGWFALTIVVAMFAACGLGLFIGSIGLITRDINLVLNVSSMLLLSLSGANFPIERLPFLLQKAAYMLPLARTIKAARLLANNVHISLCRNLLIEEVIIGCIYIAVGYCLLKYMERIAIKKATLDIY